MRLWGGKTRKTRRGWKWRRGEKGTRTDQKIKLLEKIFPNLRARLKTYSTHQTIRYTPLFSVHSYGTTCLRKSANTTRTAWARFFFFFSWVDLMMIYIFSLFSLFFTLYEYTEWFTIKSTQRTLPYTSKFSTSKLGEIGRPLLAKVQVCCKKYKFWSEYKSEELCIFWHKEKDFSFIFCIFCKFLKMPYLTQRIWGKTGIPNKVNDTVAPWGLILQQFCVCKKCRSSLDLLRKKRKKI